MDIKRYTSTSLAIIALLFFMLKTSSLKAQEDAISSYFSKYMEHKDFSSIYISSRMLRLITKNRKNDENPDMTHTLKQLNGIRILNADSINGRKLYQEIFNTLNRKSYEELMSVREPGSDVKFLIKSESENTVSELLMLVGGDNSFFMLSIIGINLDLDSVISIAEDFDPSSQEEKVEDKE